MPRYTGSWPDAPAGTVLLGPASVEGTALRLVSAGRTGIDGRAKASVERWDGSAWVPADTFSGADVEAGRTVADPSAPRERREAE